MTVETPQIYGVKDALDYGQDHVSCFRVWESLAERLGHSVRRRNVPLVCSASMHDVYLTDGVCMNHQLLFDINDNLLVFVARHSCSRRPKYKRGTAHLRATNQPVL